jgi:hypothetical protein
VDEMTDEQRYVALVFRANQLRERLEAITGGGNTIHDRNLHRNNMLYYSAYSSAMNFLQGINLHCGGARISMSTALEWFDDSCKRAEAWLTEQISHVT